MNTSRTYFQDFPGDFEAASDYASSRSRLGHNVRFIAHDDNSYRVYFSPRSIDVSNATPVKR